MPFTPFHIGPHAIAGLPFGNRLDLPVFILANVFIDLEPLAIMIYGLPYPLHGHLHSFLLSLLVLIPLSLACYQLRYLFSGMMSIIRLPYETGRTKMIISGILGGWLHILTDAPIYTDIRPFYPLESNPFYGWINIDLMYTSCAWALIPAIILYVVMRFIYDRQTT